MTNRREFRRIVRALDLIDDEILIAEYLRWHAPGAVWPEVIRYLRSIGILSMELWTVDSRVLMIMEVEDTYPHSVEEPERVREWEELMSAYQRPLPVASPGNKWTDLARIFTLDSDHSDVQ